MTADGADISRMLIFLPSRRAVRAVEKMIVARCGGAAILPRCIALGEAADDTEFVAPDDADADFRDDVVSDALRVCVCARLLAADANIGNISAALPVARDLIRMTDYLENEGIDIADVDWDSLVGDQYAAHFQAKARILDIVGAVMPTIGAGRMTRAARRNADIRAWRDVIAAGDFSRIIVCCSTASVPATADLMVAVANDARGRIILPGKIDGRDDDFALDTNPYNSEYKFLTRIGATPADVQCIDVGPSNIDFFNRAFGNIVTDTTDVALENCHVLSAPREASEAASVAEIAARAVAENKTVLVITPDAAANQRLATEFARRNLVADFSGGMSGATVPAGRAVLNLMDAWIERGCDTFDTCMRRAGGNLFQMLSDFIATRASEMSPAFDITAPDSVAVWRAISELSDAVSAAGITLDARDARAFIADALAGVSVRGVQNDAARICVLGTIESRMQTADVVILTGLNDGMFPARGYQNSWLPRHVAATAGLPSPDRKVSLMAMDFMNLSCGPCVWWTRSCVSGGTQTTESRFLSRVAAHRGKPETDMGAKILRDVIAAGIVAPRPLNSGRASPPADWSDVYVTELELLVHNPYAFYARHILRLSVKNDWWADVDARQFGTLVHAAIENAHGKTVDELVQDLDARASALVGVDSVLFHFWHRRFVEMAPVIIAVLAAMPGVSEIGGQMQIRVGDNASRTVRARADYVAHGMVMDIKTGAAPTRKQLMDGTMPQLPLEAAMLRDGGFRAARGYQTDRPEMMFLQLRSGDVRAITYDADETAQMIDAAIEKIEELFHIYTAGGAEYEYREQSDKKYRAYDDLARVDD